jgi:hypothetical protein
MKTIRAKKQSCPVCKKLLDAHTNLNSDNTPSVGDYTICAYCTSYLKYGPRLILKVATAEDISEMPNEVLLELGRMRRGLNQIKQEKHPPFKKKHD